MTEGTDALNAGKDLKDTVDGLKDLHNQHKDFKDAKNNNQGNGENGGGQNQPEATGAQNSASPGDTNGANPSVGNADNAANAANGGGNTADAANNANKANEAADAAAANSGKAPSSGEGSGAPNGAGSANQGAAAATKSGASEGSKAAATSAAQSAEAAQTAATTAAETAAEGAAEGVAEGAAAGPWGLVAAAIKEAVVQSVKKPHVAMAFVFVAIFPLFILLTFLDWINPFSTTNSTGGDNDYAQGKDIEKDEDLNLEDLSEDEMREIFEYYPVDDVYADDVDPQAEHTLLKTGQYTFLAEVIGNAIEDGYAWSTAQYPANKEPALAGLDKRTVADTMYIFGDHTTDKNGVERLPDNSEEKYFKEATEAYENKDDVPKEHKNYYDEAVKSDDAGINEELKPHESTTDHNDYLSDYSYGGTYNSVTAYILSAYSVSRGDTAPPMEKGDKDKYSYYKGLFDLLNDSEALHHYFEYQGYTQANPNVDTKDVVYLNVGEGIDYLPTGDKACKQCCQNAGLLPPDKHETKGYTLSDAYHFGYYSYKNGEYKYFFQTSSSSHNAKDKYADEAVDYYANIYSATKFYNNSSYDSWVYDNGNGTYDYYLTTDSKWANAACSSWSDAKWYAAQDWESYYASIYNYSYFYNNAYIITENAYYCPNCGNYCLATETNKVVDATREAPFWFWQKSEPVAEEFEFKTYSYHGNISPFSYQDLLERMFLDDNPFYESVKASYAAGSYGSVTITGNAAEILAKVKESWPDRMDPKREDVVKKALSGIGNLVYIWGGGHSGDYKYPRPAGVDCSGFVAWAYYNAGITDLGCHLAKDYKNLSNTRRISSSELLPGDICDRDSHVGIYIGKIDGNPVYVHSSGGSSNTASNPGLGPCTNATTFYYFCTYTGFNDNQTYNGAPSGASTVSTDTLQTSNAGKVSTLQSANNGSVIRLRPDDGKIETDPTTNVSDAQLKIVAAAWASYKGTANISYRAGWCAEWVYNVYSYAGYAVSVSDAIHNFCLYKNSKSRDITAIPVGAAVIRASGTDLGRRYGHIGIYVGDLNGDGKGDVIDNIGSICFQSLEQWIAGHESDTTHCDCGNSYTGFVGWVWPGNQPLGTGTQVTGVSLDDLGSIGAGYAGGGGGMGGYYSRAAQLAAIMASDYYQWWTMYTYTCDDPESVETKCPKCGAEVETIHPHWWMFWRSIYKFEYLKNDEPDKHTVIKLNDDGELEQEEEVFTVSQKIDYYVQDILQSIPNASAKYEQGRAAGSGYYQGVGIRGSGLSIVEFARTQIGTNGAASWHQKYGFQNHWCAMFVTYCGIECGLVDTSLPSAYGATLGNGIIPPYNVCSDGENAFKAKGLWQGKDYTPSPGDIIFFDWPNTDSDNDHTAIVEKVEGSTVYYIGGNQGGTGKGYEFYTSSKVSRDSISIGSSQIHGYGTPEYPAANLVGGDNFEKIYNYLITVEGLSKAGACAVLGNIQVETGGTFAPSALNPNDSNGLRSVGIVQWNGGRDQNLHTFCSQNGLDVNSLEGQLLFLSEELHGNSYRDYQGAATYNVLKTCQNSEGGARDAALYFARNFERCDSASHGTRADYAASFFHSLP